MSVRNAESRENECTHSRHDMASRPFIHLPNDTMGQHKQMRRASRVSRSREVVVFESSCKALSNELVAAQSRVLS